MDKAIVDKINGSGYQRYFAITGGGTGFIGNYIKMGGASKSLIGVDVPYSQKAFDRFIKGQKVESYASSDAARKLAVASYNIVLETGVPREKAFGVGVTCSLASTSPSGEREGRKHKIYVATHKMDQASCIEIILNQGRTRQEEEEMTEQAILNEVALYSTNLSSIATIRVNREAGEIYDRHFYSDRDIANLVNAEEPDALSAHKYIDHDTIAIYSGSWNPLHEAHLTIRTTAQKILRCPVLFELTVNNAEKGQLDFIEIKKRIDNLQSQEHILTNAPLIREKAALMTKRHPSKSIVFVVGYDTWKRIWDPKYCEDNDPTLEEELFKRMGVRFLVFGRGEKFTPFLYEGEEMGESLRIKDPRAEQFNMNISSSEIRRNK